MERLTTRSILLMGLLVSISLVVTGCPGPATTNNFTLKADGSTSMNGVSTFVMHGGTIDPTSETGDTCVPAVPPPVTEAKPAAGTIDDVVVGYDYWRNTTDSCTNSNIRAYRGVVLFDLSSVKVNGNPVTSNLVSSAAIDFNMPTSTSSGGQAGPVCVGQFQFVQTAWTPGPVTELNFFTQRNGFPAGASVPAPMNLPTLLPTANITSGPVQVTTGGHFKIDVVPYVKAWLDNPSANHGVMFTSQDERFYGLPNPTSLNASCTSHFSGFVLSISSL